MGLWDKVKNVTHTAVNWVEGKPDHKPDPPKPAPAASTPLTDQQKQNMLQNMQTVGLPLTSNPQAVQQQVQQQHEKPAVGALPDIISAANQGAPKNGQTVTLPSGTTIHKDPVLLDNGLSGSKTTIGIPGIEKPIEKSPGLTISNQELGGLFKTDPTYTAEQRDRDWALVNGKPTGFMGPVDPLATEAAARLNAHFNPGLLADNPNHTTYLPSSGYNAVQIAKDLSLVNTTEEGLDPRSKGLRDQALARLGKAAYMKVNQDTDQLYAQWSPLAPNCGTGASREEQIQLLVHNGMPGNRAPTYKEAAAYVQNQAILSAMRLQQAGIPLNPDNAIGNHLGLYAPDPRIPMQTPVEPLTWTDVHDWWDRFKDHPGAYIKDFGSDLKNQLGHDLTIGGALAQNMGAVLTSPLAAAGLPHVEMSDRHGSLFEVAIAAVDLVTIGTGVGKLATTAAERAILTKVAASAAAKAFAENASKDEAIAAARAAVDSFRSLPAATQEKIGASLADQADGGAGLNHSPTGGPQPTLVVPGTGEPTLGSLPWNRGGSNLPNLGQPLHELPDLEGGITPHLPTGINPNLPSSLTFGDALEAFIRNPAPADIVDVARAGLDQLLAGDSVLAVVMSDAREGLANLSDELAQRGLGGPRPRGAGGRGPGGRGPSDPPDPPVGGDGGAPLGDYPEPSMRDLVLRIDRMKRAGRSDEDIIAEIRASKVSEKTISDDQIAAVIEMTENTPEGLLRPGQTMGIDGKIRANGGAKPAPAEELPLGRQPTTTEPLDTPSAAQNNQMKLDTEPTASQRTGMVELTGSKSPWNTSVLSGKGNVGAIGGDIGEGLTRAKLNDDGFNIIAEGKEASIEVPGHPGKYFEPDFIVEKDGKIFFVESKWKGGEYTPNQIPGYGAYKDGKLRLNIGDDGSDILRQRLERLGISEDVEISGVTTYVWNDGWGPTDKVVWRAANERPPGSLTTNGDKKWREELAAWAETNAEAARRARAANDPVGALYFQVRSDALDSVGLLPPSDLAVGKALVSAMDDFTKYSGEILGVSPEVLGGAPKIMGLPKAFGFVSMAGVATGLPDLLAPLNAALADMSTSGRNGSSVKDVNQSLTVHVSIPGAGENSSRSADQLSLMAFLGRR